MHICSILYYLKDLKTVCASVANHSCSICILVNVSDYRFAQFKSQDLGSCICFRITDKSQSWNKS